MNADPSLLELLAHAALKGTAVLGAALLLGLLLRRAAAARRYAVWMTAVIVLGLLPPALLVLPAWHVLPQPPAAPAQVPDQPLPELAVVEASSTAPAAEATIAPQMQPAPASLPPVVLPTRTSPPAFHLTWDAAVKILPGLWLAITALILLRLAWGAWCLHRLEKTLAPGTCDLLDETARDMGLRRAPRLLIGAEKAVPMVWGVWRSRLLLPRGFETWPREKLRGVLLHELAHLKRRDPLALWTAQWVKALHWFNPLAWLTLRQLRADQERACDDTVLRHGMRPSDYAQHLLDLSRHARLAPGLALCALTITRCAPVEARVKAILDSKRSRESLTLRWLLGLAGFALLTTLPVAMLHAVEGPKPRGRILDRNGVVLAESTAEKARSYPLKALTTVVTGYTGKAAPEGTSPTGRSGIEKRQETALKQGQDVVLSLDARVQAIATRALSDSVQRGGMVIMDPETGGILAYVSLPVYDANRFVPTISQADWETYSKDQDRPLLDRAGSIMSAPGAVFQPVAALAAFQAGKQPSIYTCAPLGAAVGGGARFGSVTKVCRTSQLAGVPHGALTLEQALAKGCFSYFYHLGADTGYADLFSIGGHLGLQQYNGLLSAKSTPVLPSPEEAAKIHLSQRQMLDFTADMASGRGRPFTVTQMAVLYAALANGKVWEASLTKSKSGALRQDLNTLPGLPEGLARVRAALRQTVDEPQPWARSLAGSKAQIAALGDGYATGTQGPHSEVFTHHYWMAGYAPADKPRLAFALYVDESSSNSVVVPDKLGPAVRRIMEEALALPADGSGHVPPLEEGAGHVPTAVAPANGQTPPVPSIRSASTQVRASLDTYQELSQLRDKIKALETAQKPNQAAITELKKSEQSLAAQWHAVQLPPEAVPANRISTAAVQRWKAVKKAGALADLPKEAMAHVAAAEEVETRTAPDTTHFWFSAPREEVRQWLLASLTPKAKDLQAKMLVWPDAPQPFYRVYFMAGECSLHLHSVDGKTVRVQASKRKRPIMIAPDESTPPRPKTAAPRELDGVVEVGTPGTGSSPLLRLTENDPALEQVLLESGQLLSAPIIPERVQNVLRRTNLFKKQEIQLTVPSVIAPIRLPKQPLFAGKRFQQSLLVAPPDGL